MTRDRRLKLVNLIRTRPPGILLAIASALLFGASTPLAKLFTAEIGPILLAGLLYLGSGIGLGTGLLFRPRRRHREHLTRSDYPWFGAAIFFGGIVGPSLLMVGLAHTPGSTASLLLNFEAVLTAILAWFIFGENFDRRIATGFFLIVSGGLALSWQPQGGLVITPGSIAIVGACACWAVDNNLTQKISTGDPIQIAAVKGLVAGLFNAVLALVLGEALPAASPLLGALLVGLFGYGISLALFVVALRNLGTARTSAYFSIAPFIGAVLSLILFDEFRGPTLIVAAVLMGTGVWLHLTERHEHAHVHEELTHRHSHVHDEHHSHEHDADAPAGEPHIHLHTHSALMHAHRHYPDIHHRHAHR